MKPKKPCNSPWPGPEVGEKQKASKKRASQRVRSWTVQDEMRGVLRRIPQAPHEGFSILPILVREEFNKKLCPLQRRRERAQRARRGSTSSSVETEGTCVP